MQQSYLLSFLPGFLLGRPVGLFPCSVAPHSALKELSSALQRYTIVHLALVLGTLPSLVNSLPAAWVSEILHVAEIFVTFDARSLGG